MAVAALLVVAGFPLRPRPEYAIDFRVFYEAGLKAIQGESVYQSGIHLQFKYAPVVAWFFGVLFRGAAFEAALAVHFYGFLLGWVLLIRYWARSIPWAAAGLIAVASPLAEELGLGQMNLVPIALLTAVFALQRSKKKWVRDVVAALALSVAIQFKLYAALALPFFLFEGRFALLAWVFGHAVWMNAGFGAESLNWLSHLTSSTDDLLSSRYNASALGVFLKTGLPRPMAMILWILGVQAYLVLSFRMRGRDAAEKLSWTLLAILILNPLVWSYWALFSLPVLYGLTASGLWYAALPVVLVSFAHHSIFNRNGGLFVALAIAAAGMLKKSVKAREV